MLTGHPNEDRLLGAIPRQLRRALERRLQLMEDPRFCRLVNGEGDSLPGLAVDRYLDHYAVQTFSPELDRQAEEIARSLVEVAGARAVVLRNDTPRRLHHGLKVERPHVLLGTPPRWGWVAERGARYTVDLLGGAGTGFRYDHRSLRRRVGQLSHGARVLDPWCSLGSLLVPAGLHGARSILAFDPDRDAVDLARENLDANGLLGRAEVAVGGAFEALEATRDPFDLVLLGAAELPPEERLEADPFVRLVRLCAQHTRHGGRLIVAGYHPPLPREDFDLRVAFACEQAGRVAYRLARIGPPLDFPAVLGSPGGEHLSAVALELS